MDINGADNARMADNRLNQLKGRINYLLRISNDPAFTQYLRMLQGRVTNQERQLELMAAELEKNVGIYESIQQRQREAAARQMVQTVPQPMPLTQPRPAAEPAPQPTVQPVSQSTVQPVSQPVVQPVPKPMGQSVPQAAPRPMAQSMTPAQPRRNAEFAVGAAVLSIVGGIFILISMTMLGLYYMEGMMKGLLLYAVCLIVMAASELFLYRRWPRLGMTFSAIGMGGLYISTLINYLVLHNFNYWVALGLNLTITLAVILLSRRRDAVAYRVLGMVAAYICILIVPEAEAGMVNDGLSQAQFLTVTVTVFIINIMCLLVPVKKAHTGIHVTHMALNTAFVFIAYFVWVEKFYSADGTKMDSWLKVLFVMLSVLVMQMIFSAQIRWREKQTPGSSMKDNVCICVAYAVSSLFYAILVGVIAGYPETAFPLVSQEYAQLCYRLTCSAAVIVICMIPMLALRTRQEKWFAWYLLNLLVFIVHIGAEDRWETSICILALLVVSKLLSFTKRQMVCNCDVTVTLIACLFVLILWKETYVIPLVVGLVLSVLCVNYWHVYFELLLTFTLAFYTTNHMLSALELPVFVGILFVGMLIFNNVKRWHGEGMIVYNGVVLFGQAVCYLLLFNPVYRNSYITYLCMLIFGVATLVVCLQAKYHLDFKYKQLVLAVFLTYMGLITRTSYPILNSILLMVVALACVGAGFAIQRKEVRVYGLVLSLAVCVKLILYDFMGANTLQKTILFFVVGVLALMIAAIYMVLERSWEKKNLPQQGSAEGAE